MTIFERFEKLKNCHPEFYGLTLNHEVYRQTSLKVVSWDIALQVVIISCASVTTTLWATILFKKFNQNGSATNSIIDAFAIFWASDLRYPVIIGNLSALGYFWITLKMKNLGRNSSEAKGPRKEQEKLLQEIKFTYFGRTSLFTTALYAYCITWILILAISTFLFLKLNFAVDVILLILIFLAVLATSFVMFTLATASLSSIFSPLFGGTFSQEENEPKLVFNLIKSIEICDTYDSRNQVSLADKHELIMYIQKSDDCLKAIDRNYRKLYNISPSVRRLESLEKLNTWAFLAQEGTFKSIGDYLAVILKATVTGNFHDIPKNDDPVSAKAENSVVRKLAFGVMVAIPLVLVLALEPYMKFTITNGYTNTCAMLYAVWIYLAFVILIRNVDDRTMAIFKEILQAFRK